MAHRNSPVTLHTGDLLSSRFLLEEPLARGSSATVWRATDQVLGRHVAVKSLNPALLGDRAKRAQMQMEAQALASLRHPHVAALYDFATQPTGAGHPLPFLVLELVD